MNVDLSGRRAVVTGGSRGIGAAVVRALAASGAAVAFCARDPEGVKALCGDLEQQGLRVAGITSDLSSREATAAFLDGVEAELGGADILVNNVGVSPSRSFLRMSDEDWLDLFELNLLTAVRCTRRLLPGMRERRWGRVVMISSASAKYPDPALVDYAASKAALVATGKALARRYGRDNILVTSVLPGLIRTPMWERAAAEIASARGTTAEQVFEGLASSVPLGRFGSAAEVANLVLFLASEAASYVNGAAIDVDGGLGEHIF